jgi:hypothetical protein
MKYKAWVSTHAHCDALLHASEGTIITQVKPAQPLVLWWTVCIVRERMFRIIHAWALPLNVRCKGPCHAYVRAAAQRLVQGPLPYCERKSAASAFNCIPPRRADDFRRHCPCMLAASRVAQLTAHSACPDFLTFWATHCEADWRFSFRCFNLSEWDSSEKK